MATKNAAAKSTAKAADAAEFTPRLVHAYRRVPHMVPAPGGLGEVEKAVEVVFDGEKVVFKSNEAGHVVGLVNRASTFKRLTREIPEAYIEYAGGENVPAQIKPIESDAPIKPDGEFVLFNGTEYVVLDDQSDEEVREFAAAAGIEDEALPEVLVGEALKQAVVNLLQTA